MRYSEIDLQCEDITWFGVDAINHVAAFASGGIGTNGFVVSAYPIDLEE